MTKQAIINLIVDSGYFSIKELVCDHVYNVHHNSSWQFLDKDLLETIYILRTDILKVPMYINNWSYSKRTGTRYAERGLRCNLSTESSKKTKSGKLYMSAHCNGCAIDFDAKGYSAEEVRKIIKENEDKLPYPIRLEKNVNWVHLDLFNYDESIKVKLF